MKKMTLGITLSIILSPMSFASSPEINELKNEVLLLKQMMKELKKSNNELRAYQNATAKDSFVPASRNAFSKLEASVEELKTNLEGNEKSGFQLAGYASFGWQDAQKNDNEFDLVQFSPIFHYQYGSMFQFEGELEVKVGADGDTEIDLEYAAGNIFLNDYVGLIVGKFMSPIGQFVQNGHPSWINKMPSAPLGFGHDGAAPTSNIGIELRGGLPKFANTRSNYAVFVSNAPVFGIAADGDTIIDTSGKTSSNDVSKTWGGRFAVNPISGMEVGVSMASGDIAEELAGGKKIARDYEVVGFDGAYHYDNFILKGEYIKQKVGENDLSTLEGGTWRAWYSQLSYQFQGLNLEPVIRYGDYSNPEIKRKQLALGLNYLFSNNVIAKLAYENNKDKDGNAVNSKANDNRLLAQFAFGF